MENRQSLEKSEALTPLVVPIVEYDSSLQKEEVPYEVNVDGEKCAELFREIGISDDEISKLKIKVKRKSLLRRGPFASYRPINGDTIILYTDPIWRAHQKYLNPQKPSLKKEIVSVVKDIVGGYNGPVDLFLHESKHASDFRGKLRKSLGMAFYLTYYLGGTIGFGLAINKSLPMVPLNELLLPLAYPVLYAANPIEIRARRFADKNKDDPRWQNILIITPKPKQ